jgi:ABC-type Mn2+/Zn2+ transport system ATPase subunit
MTRAAGAARPPLFSFEEVRLGYDGADILERVSLHVARGDLVGLVGPNGAGKTTLLRAVLGTLRPRAGRVEWAGGRSARIGYVPQRESLDALWPLRVLDLVLMGRTALVGRFHRFSRDDQRAATEALIRVGIADLAEAPPSELSGGQVQRALIARALAGEPELLILDEPTTGMDLAGTAAMLGLIRDLHASGGLTLLVVSHDLGVIAAVAERIALLHEKRLREGDHDSILSPEVLGAVYHLPIEVAIRGTARVVFPPLPPEEARP